MYRASSGTQLRSMHKALSHGPTQPQFAKNDARSVTEFLTKLHTDIDTIRSLPDPLRPHNYEIKY